MVTIPKILNEKYAQMAQAAKKMVSNSEKTLQKEGISQNSLLRSPISDSFEKKAYMETDSFWYQPQNFANYAKGQYLTEGGKAVQDSHKVGEKVIAKTDKLERGFAIETTTPKDVVIYYEKDLSNGNIHSVELSSGLPYMSYIGKQKYNVLYHNPVTGAPTTRVQHIIGGGGGKIITDFAEDGTTVISRRAIASGVIK